MSLSASGTHPGERLLREVPPVSSATPMCRRHVRAELLGVPQRLGRCPGAADHAEQVAFEEGAELVEQQYVVVDDEVAQRQDLNIARRPPGHADLPA